VQGGLLGGGGAIGVGPVVEDDCLGGKGGWNR